jgi:group I intron endonuclease
MADVGTYYIYEVVNTITGDTYIGSTCNVGRRWAEHKYIAFKPNDRAYHRPLYEDMRRYGADVFDKRVLEILTCSNEERLKREQYHIDTTFPVYNQKSSYVHCPHGRRHSMCRDCDGATICKHKLQRQQCGQCNDYTCPFCDKRLCSKRRLSGHILTQHFVGMLNALTDDTY